MDFVNSLRSPDVETRIEAASELMFNSADQSSIAHQILFALSDKSEEVRELICSFLEDLEMPLASGLPQLLEQANSPNDLVSYWALTLIGRLGPVASNASTLCQTIANNHQRGQAVRDRAALTLTKISTRPT